MAREHRNTHFRLWGYDGWPFVIHASQTWEWPKESAWYVYTMYEGSRADGCSRIRVPLYVGCTQQLHARLGQHRRSRAWWPLVGDIIVERFPSRTDALDAEHDRIRRMAPLFNIAGNVHTHGLDMSILEEVQV